MKANTGMEGVESVIVKIYFYTRFWVVHQPQF
jgi:hypothetical protein